MDFECHVYVLLKVHALHARNVKKKLNIYR